jgi:cell division transport system permease protein
LRALGYAFDEALVSLWRGWQAGVLSTATIAVALFVLGGFLLITSNLERLGSEWNRAAEVSVYLADEATADERTAVEGALTPGLLVASVEYVSKDDAARRFRETFADLTEALDALEDNPLPASFEVRLEPSATPEAVERLAETLRQTPGVADVRFDREWLERLLRAITVVRSIGFALGTMLTLAAALTVANVVRLALFARRDELEIMDLVGAPPAYVRGPFVMEGVLQGGIGATLALAALAGTFLAVRGRYLAPLAEAVNLSSVRFLPIELCALLLLGGMLVGCVGGLVATSARS